MTVTLDQKIGLKVRKLRDKASLSQNDAASTCDLTLREFQDGEAGTRRFTSHELFRLGTELNVSLSDIFRDFRRAG